jgi:hypothetical protein
VEKQLLKQGYVRTQNAIIKKAKRYGLDRKIDYLWSLKEIAPLLEVSVSAIQRTLSSDKEHIKTIKKGHLVFVDEAGLTYLEAKYKQVDPEKFYSTLELAEHFSLAHNTVKKWCTNGHIEYIKVRGKNYVPTAVVEQLSDWFKLTGRVEIDWALFPLEEGYIPLRAYVNRTGIQRKTAVSHIKSGKLEGKFLKGKKRGRWLVKI